jgi:hypothetical protein
LYVSVIPANSPSIAVSQWDAITADSDSGDPGVIHYQSFRLPRIESSRGDLFSEVGHYVGVGYIGGWDQIGGLVMRLTRVAG